MRIKDQTERDGYRHVWVVAEQRGGRLEAVTFEVLGAGRRLAECRGQELWCVVLGHQIEEEAEKAYVYGADQVLIVDAPELADQLDLSCANTLARLITRYRPEIVLTGATMHGRSVIPRVAGMLEAGLTADCTGLDIEEESGLLLQTRPAFGGNIMATIKSSEHLPQMATVRPRVMNALEPDPNRGGQVIREPFVGEDEATMMELLKTELNQEQVMSISDAHIIVAGGRGVKGERGFDLLKQLARRLGGAVGATRAAVDAGWIEYAHQVGQTGQSVQPRVYIACGISGQIQHLVGMQSADTIIAINADPQAPLMQIADYAVVGDLFDVIPALLEELTHL